MECQQFEIPISDYLENQLSPADRACVAAHLAGCADCRAFAQQFELLDAALLHRLKAPTLPATFKARLQKRIQTETVVLSEAQLAERKHQLQAEYEMALAQLSQVALSPHKILEGLGNGGLIALAGGLAWLILPQSANLLAGHALDSINQSLLLSLIASAIFVAIGLAAAFPRRVRRILSAV